MFTIYIKPGDEFDGITAISSESTSDICLPALIETPSIDFSKIAGYEITRKGDSVYLTFSQQRYDTYLDYLKKQKEYEEGKRLFKQLTAENILSNATDEQALTMKYLYDEWKSGNEYLVDDRMLYNDDLYRVIQAHTAQTDWTPDKTKSLYMNIADPAIEYPEFVQPTGAHDAYKKDDKVTYKGKHYVSLIDNNTWAPDVYTQGWKNIE